MFLLALCLIGTAMAAPAIPEAPIIPPESQYVMAPLVPIRYSLDPQSPLRTLDVMIEPEPKEENYESPEPQEETYEPKEENYDTPEPKEEFFEPQEPKEEPVAEPAPEAPLPEEPKPTEPVIVKLEIPKPPSFISDWFSFLPSFSLPNITIPPFISNLFSSNSSPPKILYPAYYAGYPGPVIVEAAKP